MKLNSKVMMLLMVGLIILNVGAAAVSAQEQQTLADTGECILWTAEGYVDPEADAAGEAEGDEVNETDDDAAGEDADEAGDVDEGGDDAEGDHDTATEDRHEAGITGSVIADEAALNGLTTEARCDALVAQATISVEEAQAAAEVETGGVVVQIELDVEHGFLVYCVDLEDGTEVKVDAGNGDILATKAAESETEEDDAHAAVPANLAITQEEAQAIAEAETGGTARDVEFEVEGGVEIWEVEMQDGTDVEVNANDGTIILIEERDGN